MIDATLDFKAPQKEGLVISSLCLVGDHRFDDGKDLLLLVAGKSGTGFELAFELRLGAAFRSLRADADA